MKILNIISVQQKAIYQIQIVNGAIQVQGRCNYNIWGCGGFGGLTGHVSIRGGYGGYGGMWFVIEYCCYEVPTFQNDSLRSNFTLTKDFVRNT